MYPQKENVYSAQIEHMLDELIPDFVSYTIAKYSPVFSSHLGMDDDDIRSEIRASVWRAILTHDTSKSASLKTYTRRCIDNRMKDLCRRTSRKKNTMIRYFAESPAAGAV